MIEKILKFGGSSVGSAEMIRRIGGIVSSEVSASGRKGIAVVVSAFQGVTDELLAMARLAGYPGDPSIFDSELKLWLFQFRKRHLDALNALIKKPKKLVSQLNHSIEIMLNELEGSLRRTSKQNTANGERETSPKDLDSTVSFGERLSSLIVAAYLSSLEVKGRKIDAFPVDARDLVKTDSNFLNASVDFQHTNRRIREFFAKGRSRLRVPVITGFLGSNSKGETTTLGRGGSDYTAAIFGAALDAELIEIWTDVDGIMSADPRLVKAARVLEQLSYEEAMEWAYFGAKVIHPATMLPAIKKGIPLLIQNTFNPSARGTLISKAITGDSVLVKGVTSIDDIALVIVGGVSLVGIPGSAERVFRATRKEKVNVILISQASSEHTICFGIKQSELESALSALREEFGKEIRNGQVTLDSIKEQSIIAAVGEGMRGKPGIAGRLFKSLGDQKVNITAVAQGGSERNISFVIDSGNKVKALNLVHSEFCEAAGKNIFIAGTGNLGSRLLQQISALSGKNQSALRVCGIINTGRMLMNEVGIDCSNWNKMIRDAATADFAKWIDWAKSLPIPRKVFVDCTANEFVARKYVELADAGFHIVAANKKFNVFPMKEYNRLREILARNAGKFLYETNVGAGLPVISTLRDLLDSGDGVLRIEGIFSGTLSYIFHQYDGNRPFSDIVRTAQELGYTEPDPREDLNGQDVGRKLLILAREMGMELEMKNIRIQNLVPFKLRKVKSVEAFLHGLKYYDGRFQKLLKRVLLKGRILHYVARLEAGEVSASLQEVSRENPLASTKPGDNVFAFYTKRYSKRPLVVQGPGAGAEVTAGGVLADILKV